MVKKNDISIDQEENSEELIQIINPEEDLGGKNENFPQVLPILTIKNTVLFPGVIIPITVTRQKSVRLIREAYQGNKIIGVISQKNKQVEEPKVEDLYSMGVLARIIKIFVLPDGNTTIIIQGKRRFLAQQFLHNEPYLSAHVNYIAEKSPDNDKKFKALIQSIREAAHKILKLNPDIPADGQAVLDNIQSSAFLIHFLASNLNVEVEEKQRILEVLLQSEQGTLLLSFMMREIQMLELKNEIHKKVHSDIDQQQRDYFLRQQIKVLQDELGNEGPGRDLENLKRRASEMQWNKKTSEHFNKEIERLQRSTPSSPEYGISLNYVEFMLDLPWNKYSTDNLDLKRARKILDKDHFGLQKIKERIIEYLAVLKLKGDMRGPILCLYGPPGVGKTSLGKSIASALQRQYVRMSLGGVHDEAEIRGHRKTYIGAMPGKILHHLKKAKTSNPVFVLDEIDKLQNDFRGDPSSALLEVLDPEQNNAFSDNYLEVEYDLSKTLFIATANTLETIPLPLRDRMEIIELSGYSMEEKIEIAHRHLVPKQISEHGLKTSDLKITKESLRLIIECYTRESGVRSLERQIGKVVRRIAKAIASEEPYSEIITPKEIDQILGAEIFEKELYTDNSVAGVVVGLAWTKMGGDILFIESSLSRGKGALTLSGQLGDVMKESAMAALTYLRANAKTYGIDYRVFQQYDLHIHVPAGAVPKDGPSAGITMLTALASLFTQRKVKSRLAMTGEITLRGAVLPVGGIKEKILAAKRSGIKEIVLSEKNKRNVEEIEKDYVKGLTFHYVNDAAEVLQSTLLQEKVKHPITFEFEHQQTGSPSAPQYI